MELTYTLTENDYIQYNLFHYKNSKTMKRQFATIGILMPLILIGLGFLITKRLEIVSVGIALIFVVIWFLFRRQILKRIVIRSVNKLMKEGKINEFVGTQTLSLLDEKIRIVDPYRTQEYSYKTVQSIQYDPERLYIYVGTLTAIIVPLSAFGSKDEEKQFVDFIKERTV